MKENSSHQLQSSNPHSELTPEQIAKLDHVKEQGLTFVDPEGGGEALTALLARMSSVSALSELKNTKNALDAKALAESDGTSETMQVGGHVPVMLIFFHVILVLSTSPPPTLLPRLFD